MSHCFLLPCLFLYPIQVDEYKMAYFQGFNPAPADPKPCTNYGCMYLIAPEDTHMLCMFCLGLTHARNAFEKRGWCPACFSLSDGDKGDRLTRVNARAAKTFVEAPDRGASRDWPPPRSGLDLGLCAPSTSGPRVPAATSQRRIPQYPGSPARKVARAELDPSYEAFLASRGRVPAPSFSFSAFRSEHSFGASGAASVSYAREDVGFDVDDADSFHGYDDTYAPLARDETWDSIAERDLPVDPELDPQDDPDGFKVVDQVGFGEDDEDNDGDVAEDAPDVGPPILARELDPPPPDQDAATPRPHPESWDLIEVLRQASGRCGRSWPSVDQAQDAGDDWPGCPRKPAPRKVVLPLARGFQSTFIASWDSPTSKYDHVKAAFDTERMVESGFSPLPIVGPIVGAYLNNPRATPVRPLGKDPTLPAKDGEASKAAAATYGLVVAQAKHLNAVSLLQGAISKVLEEMGNLPVPKNDNAEDLDRYHEQIRRGSAELDRYNQEMVKFTWAAASIGGHVASSLVVAERVRWLNTSPHLDANVRKGLLEGPIEPGGLFAGALERLALKVEAQRPGCEALSSLTPRPPPRQQQGQLVPRQVQRQQGQRPSQRQGQQGGGGGRNNSNRPQQPRQGTSADRHTQRDPPTTSRPEGRDGDRRGTSAALTGGKKHTGKGGRGQQRK